MAALDTVNQADSALNSPSALAIHLFDNKKKIAHRYKWTTARPSDTGKVRRTSCTMRDSRYMCSICIGKYRSLGSIRSHSTRIHGLAYYMIMDARSNHQRSLPHVATYVLSVINKPFYRDMEDDTDEDENILHRQSPKTVSFDVFNFYDVYADKSEPV